MHLKKEYEQNFTNLEHSSDIKNERKKGILADLEIQSNQIIISLRMEKKIQPTNGNLVFDHPVPNGVFDKDSFTFDEEFTNIRYTAITCDPDKFLNKQYSIRQKNYKRNTEIMI
ncbi:45958_t:CDS:2, partial [Gigaspora margarita]